jgi:hypothetical protein
MQRRVTKRLLVVHRSSGDGLFGLVPALYNVAQCLFDNVHGRSILPSMTPTRRHELLKLWSEVDVRSALLHEAHGWTYRSTLPDGLGEKLNIVPVLSGTVWLRLQSHDLPHDDCEGKHVTLLVVAPTKSHFWCHYIRERRH